MGLNNLKLSVNLSGLILKNPVMTASGTFGYAEEYSNFIDINKLGAIVCKGISLKPMAGNPPPRIYETACGLLNAIGLQNVGLEVFLSEKLPFLKKYKTKIIVNVLGSTINEYVELSERLDEAGVDGIELNVSCPNVKEGGVLFGSSSKILARLVKNVRKVIRKTILIIKLPPDIFNIVNLAKVVEDYGADAVTLTNTIPAMAIDILSRRPQLSNITGGLSGPAIKPIALKLVWDVSKIVKIPIIGVGGILNYEDAIEFILAGATAIQVGTANFLNPNTTIDIIRGIEQYMKANSIRDIRELIGAVQCRTNLL